MPLQPTFIFVLIDRRLYDVVPLLLRLLPSRMELDYKYHPSRGRVRISRINEWHRIVWFCTRSAHFCPVWRLHYINSSEFNCALNKSIKLDKHQWNLDLAIAGKAKVHIVIRSTMDPFIENKPLTNDYRKELCSTSQLFQNINIKLIGINKS